MVRNLIRTFYHYKIAIDANHEIRVFKIRRQVLNKYLAPRVRLNYFHKEVQHQIRWNDNVSLVYLKQSVFKTANKFFRVVTFILNVVEDFKPLKVTLLRRWSIFRTKKLKYFTCVLNISNIRRRDSVESANNQITAASVNEIPFVKKDLVLL